TDKGAARDALSGWLAGLPAAAQPVLVRINAAGTEWFDEDLALTGMAGIAGVVLPKAERVDDIERLLAAGAPAVLPLIESALGLHHALELARAPQVERLLFGSIDFSVDLGMEESVESLQYFRSHLVLASRL